MGGLLFSLVLTVVILGVSAVMFYKVFWPMIRQAQGLMGALENGAREHQRLMATGVPGQAQVLTVQQTGTLVNHAPQVAMDLEVHPTNGAPSFRTRCLAIVDLVRLPQVQPGCTVPVRIDPMNPTRVALAMA